MVCDLEFVRVNATSMALITIILRCIIHYDSTHHLNDKESGRTWDMLCMYTIRDLITQTMRHMEGGFLVYLYYDRSHHPNYETPGRGSGGFLCMYIMTQTATQTMRHLEGVVGDSCACILWHKLTPKLWDTWKG